MTSPSSELDAAQKDAYQHLLSMFVAVITPALLICQALGLPAQDTQHIISMSLFERVSQTATINLPTPLYYGLGFDWNLLPLMLIFMVTSLETIGDITATSDVSEQPVSGPLYMKRL